MKSDTHPFTPKPPDAAGVISWVHIGDLHMTESGKQNHQDLQRIVAAINQSLCSAAFAFLPGDVADQGSEAQYAVVRQALDELDLPWCAIVGDHDVHEKSFENFLRFMANETRYAFTVGNVQFFALNAFDEPDPGSFAMLPEQLSWLESDLRSLTPEQSAVLLLHCYPSDLKQGGAELQRLIDTYPVRLIDMGHTHYNEIANNGRLLYTATRSTGQIEEGPVGFSITNLDGEVISWKFYTLDALPRVMITSPADERLIPEERQPLKQERKPLRIRAKVFSALPAKSVQATLLGRLFALQVLPGSTVFEAMVDPDDLPTGIHALTVELVDESGKTANDEIRIVIGEMPQSPRRKPRDQDNAVEAWPERGLLGTQLGPNKNGKKW